MTTPVDVPQVAVIVPTRNSAETIDRCLSSILGQDTGVEIVVVDNHSSDGTADIAARLGIDVVIAGPERSTQRNVGAARTQAPWLLFVDSDMLLQSGVVRSCLEVCEKDSAEAAIVPELAAGEGFFAKCRALEKRCYLGDDEIEAARFFRRDLFDKVGGYDEDLYAGEDWDLSIRIRRVGARVARSKEAIIHWEGRISLRETFQTKRYYGRSLRTYRAKHLNAPQLSPNRSALLRSWKELGRTPHLAAGLILLKVVEFAGVASGLRSMSAPTYMPLDDEEGDRRPLRVVHINANFNEDEGLGRWMVELSRRMPSVESYVATNRVTGRFDPPPEVFVVGGSASFFQFTRRRQLAGLLDRLRADLVHLHGGILGAFSAVIWPFRGRIVLSIYAWPRLPAISQLRRSSWRELRRSAILPLRALLVGALPDSAVGLLLRAGRVNGALTSQADVVERLRQRINSPVVLVKGGASSADVRARFRVQDQLLVFAGRAETARGIDTLLHAMPMILDQHPALRLRMLLLPAPQLQEISHLIHTLGLARNVDLQIGPVEDVMNEFSEASVGVFPFKFDFTTITPPLTVMEAMSVGLPIIGTDVACLRGPLVDGHNGIIVPKDDAGAIASAVRRVVSDRALWERLSGGALETVSREWNWDNAARTTAGFYRKALDA